MTRPLPRGRLIETSGDGCPRLMIEGRRHDGHRTRLTRCRFSFLFVEDMQIELVLSPALYDLRQLQSGHSTVAVDVLRATSAICAAFQVGALSVVPLDSLDPLPEYRDKGYVLAAERNGCKVLSATCGNSPTEYMTMDLHGCNVAFSTTNGTVAILKAVESNPLFVGAFANLSALADAIPADRPLVILCSGWKGDPSIEDTLFAGALIKRLQQRYPDATLVNDAAMAAIDLWEIARGDLYSYCSKATHVKRLQRLNYDNDIRWALTSDTCQVVPVYDPHSHSLRLL